jgi:hypothetical protein
MIKSGPDPTFQVILDRDPALKLRQVSYFKKGNSEKVSPRSWGYDHLSGADGEKCGGCLHAASASNEICNPGCEPLIFSSPFI